MEITISACIVQIKYNYNIKHTTVSNITYITQLYKVNYFNYMPNIVTLENQTVHAKQMVQS